MSAIERTAPMDSATETSPSTAVPICTQAGGVGNVAMSKDVDKKEKKKRKAVRRDPEKRRKQNSQAQKKYREKLRKRLDDLEKLAASVAKTEQTATAVTAETAFPVTPVSYQTDETPRDWSLPGRDEERWAQPEPSPTTPPDVSLPKPAEVTSPDWSFWDCAIFIDPSYLTMTNYSRPKTQENLSHARYLDCGCSVRHVEIRTKSSGCDGSDIEYVRVGETAASSDPYMNHIRVEMVCTMAAMWEIRLQLGISELALCDDDSQSPFYRPGTSGNLIASGENEALDARVVRTVQSIWKTLKPDIRPLKEQVTVPHHPSVDVLPFPTLRKNLLTGAVVVDEEEFCHDSVNGLMCWGGAGVGRGDRNGATGKASTGRPWDHRSWDAKPWFIRKYWVALGGEDGELVRQSEWWRSTRGEEVDIWTSEA